jgi:hypothetical protein
MREEGEKNNAYGNDMEDLGRTTSRLEHLHYPNKSGHNRQRQCLRVAWLVTLTSINRSEWLNLPRKVKTK